MLFGLGLGFHLRFEPAGVERRSGPHAAHAQRLCRKSASRSLVARVFSFVRRAKRAEHPGRGPLDPAAMLGLGAQLVLEALDLAEAGALGRRGGAHQIGEQLVAHAERQIAGLLLHPAGGLGELSAAREADEAHAEEIALAHRRGAVSEDAELGGGLVAAVEQREREGPLRDELGLELGGVAGVDAREPAEARRRGLEHRLGVAAALGDGGLERRGVRREPVVLARLEAAQRRGGRVEITPPDRVAGDAEAPALVARGAAHAAGEADPGEGERDREGEERDGHERDRGQRERRALRGRYRLRFRHRGDQRGDRRDEADEARRHRAHGGERAQAVGAPSHHLGGRGAIAEHLADRAEAALGEHLDARAGRARVGARRADEGRRRGDDPRHPVDQQRLVAAWLVVLASRRGAVRGGGGDADHALVRAHDRPLARMAALEQEALVAIEERAQRVAPAGALEDDRLGERDPRQRLRADAAPPAHGGDVEASPLDVAERGADEGAERVRRLDLVERVLARVAAERPRERVVEPLQRLVGVTAPEVNDGPLDVGDTTAPHQGPLVGAIEEVVRVGEAPESDGAKGRGEELRGVADRAPPHVDPDEPRAGEDADERDERGKRDEPHQERDRDDEDADREGARGGERAGDGNGGEIGGERAGHERSVAGLAIAWCGDSGMGNGPG